MINLPAVAYVFNPFQPSGWVDAHLLETAMTVELRCLDPKHRWHGRSTTCDGGSETGRKLLENIAMRNLNLFAGSVFGG
ncbi:MAG TPA: hypothetical protein VFC46_15075 [Humisphaera sp.]|nr:hypothetical protein [Humisphaera sp.]